MERRAEPTHVPENTIERVVRQMVEHGARDLLFDESESRGAAFLNHAVRAIAHLPQPSGPSVGADEVALRSLRAEERPRADA